MQLLLYRTSISRATIPLKRIIMAFFTQKYSTSKERNRLGNVFLLKTFWINPRVSDVALVASNLPPWHIFHKHSQMLWQERLVSLLSGAKENFIFSSVIQTVENKMMWQERPLSMLANRIILSFVSNTAKNIFKNKHIFFLTVHKYRKRLQIPQKLKKINILVYFVYCKNRKRLQIAHKNFKDFEYVIF